MLEPALSSPMPAAVSEEEFAARVDEWSASADRHAALRDLLREEDAAYLQRSGAAVIRMRGWVLVGLTRLGLDEADLPFVIEELESGNDPYLVAASARALRTYREPLADFLPYLLRAFANLWGSDEPLSFEAYGEYAVARSETTAIGELVRTLEWLAPVTRESLSDLESLARTGVPQKYRRDVSRIVKEVRRPPRGRPPAPACCRLPEFLRGLSIRKGTAPPAGELGKVVFEDQSRVVAPFAEMFGGRPTIVVFFYTRCDNPLKCSLTVTKLAGIQKLLEERGLTGEIQTAAITYDPHFDHPERMARYGLDRGLRTGDRHRMLRTTESLDLVQRHFGLGINFVGALVNRHRLEVFILDRDGSTAIQFSRLQWSEQQVLERAVEVLRKTPAGPSPASSAMPIAGRRRLRGLTRFLGVAGSIGAAFFPKCPVCWAAYLSMFGVAGLSRIPYLPWLLPVMSAAMLINLASVGWRGRETGRLGPFYLVGAGALAILCVLLQRGGSLAATAGVLFTLVGTFWATLDPFLRRAPET